MTAMMTDKVLKDSSYEERGTKLEGLPGKRKALARHLPLRCHTASTSHRGCTQARYLSRNTSRAPRTRHPTSFLLCCSEQTKNYRFKYLEVKEKYNLL